MSKTIGELARLNDEDFTDELEEGSLIVPFGWPIKARKKYVLAYREGALNTPTRRAIHDWLVAQAQVCP